MDLTYTVKGADGNEYGPATLSDVNAWLREGRINGETQIKRSDADQWAPAKYFSELATSQGSTPTPAVQQVPSVPNPVASQPIAAVTVAGGDPATVAQLKGGASWFYWIAGLSLINSIAAFTGGEWRFILGLGITQLIDAFGQSLEGGGKMIVLMLDVLAAGVFIFFGVFANKSHTWAFIAGMVLFALDGLINLLFQDWLGLGFHVFVLFCLFRGFQACRELNAR